MPSGATRFPDEVDQKAKTLLEVKNVKSLSYTQQLRDYAAYAKAKGLEFQLWVRRSTTYSAPLQQAIDEELIELYYIPGAK